MKKAKLKRGAKQNSLRRLLFLLFLVGKMSAAMSLGKEYVDLATFDHIKVDLRYASSNNFLNENLYGDFKRALLHEKAASKVKIAIVELQKVKPGWSLLIFDALRPRSIQKRLFAKVKGTPQESYVADPASGSIHNYGLALDLSLADASGNEVDMGTGFDDFRDLAQPQHEEKFLKTGALSEKQVNNRRLLRTVMTKAGFLTITEEWWHFDAFRGAKVRKEFRIIETID